MAQEIRIQETLKASPQEVFDYLADHEKFVALFGGQGRRIVDGAETPNGLGSVRRIGAGPIAVEETITAVEPPHRIEYRITRGSPLRDHRGEIRLSAEGAGTRLDYQIQFRGRLPLIGHIVAAALRAGWRRHARRQLQSLG